jgi:SAM-dependent methyltransferase
VTSTARCLACGGPLTSEPVLIAPDRMHGIPGSWPVHECLDCGSGTTLPLEQESSLPAFYPDEYPAHEVPRGIIASAMALMQRVRNHRFPVASLARGGRPGTLLDIGCGRGDLAASLINDGWAVIGVEPSPEAASIAEQRGAEVRVGTLSTVPLSPESLDAAVFRHSLEHVVDPRRDLRIVYEALRSGGKVAVIVPNWGSWQRRAFGQYWFGLELPRHRTHFTAEGVRAGLAAAGFQDIEVKPGTPLITTTWSLQFRLFDRCLTTAGASLLAGYAVSVPVMLFTLVVDRLLGDGDFLHAVATRPA